MAVVKITNFAVDDLRIVDFFDPDSAFNYATDDELSLVSRDGYELVLEGSDFDFDNDDAPTDGTITDVFLYDPFGDLVGRIDGMSASLEDYFETVNVDDRPRAFTADILSGDDTITGSVQRDKLEGYGGDDSINGGGSSDIILGGAGDDTIVGGNGPDDIDGGSGDDLISGGDERDLIYGFKGNDTINAGGGDDDVSGEAGDDVISGGADSDTLQGDSGNDVLKGDGGVDELFGGSGNDTLVGGADEDGLVGGSGDDQFRFTSSTGGVDEVLDFKRGEDLLAFKASGFANLGPDFDLVVGNAPSADSGKATFLYDVDDRELFYDSNGTGAGGSTLIAELDDVTKLTKGDFLII